MFVNETIKLVTLVCNYIYLSGYEIELVFFWKINIHDKTFLKKTMKQNKS